MWFLQAKSSETDEITWKYIDGGGGEATGLKILFYLPHSPLPYNNHTALNRAIRLIKKNRIEWLTPGAEEWTVNLDVLKTRIPEINKITWFKGVKQLNPEFEPGGIHPNPENPSQLVPFSDVLALYIKPFTKSLSSLDHLIPVELSESLMKFQNDFPDPKTVAFLIMSFSKTPIHDEIQSEIKKKLKEYDIDCVRSDYKEYHEDLYYNILTYLWGSGLSIAIYERIESEYFNPNVSLEVGYALALRKPVCLLKEKTLKTIQTDLVGKLYREFDIQNISGSLPDELMKWLHDKEIIKEH